MATRNISQIYDLMEFVVRKYKGGSFVTIDEAMETLDTAQLTCLEEWFAPYGENQILHDAILPFKIDYVFVSDVSGRVTYPSDYLHLVSNVYTSIGSTRNKVTFKNEDEWVDATNSQLRAPSATAPIARDVSKYNSSTGVNDGGFVIFPFTLQAGTFTYLQRPPTPVYAYTQVGRVVTYDPANSVQLQWTDAFVNKVIAKALKYWGIDLDEQGVSAFAESMDKENSV